MDMDALARTYRTQGFLTGIPVIDNAAARRHRTALEAAEAELGTLHYKAKMHTILPACLELATHPVLLDIVERLIGQNILLYDTAYIIKEPGSSHHVSWHQDLTYWGFDAAAIEGQVSLWLALSPATRESGCMHMLPGSHRWGTMPHTTTQDESNVLLQGQTVEHVPDDGALACELRPGEASLHHGRTLHASFPNRSADRRIGLNAQYIIPNVRQIKHDRDTAMLVRGRDTFGHFAPDIPARRALEADAITRWQELNRLHLETQGSA